MKILSMLIALFVTMSYICKADDFHDKGEKGDKGERRDRGEHGDRGDHGEKGDEGKSGKDGHDGLNGRDGGNGKDEVQGPKGDKGDKGDKGNAGKDADVKPIENKLNNEIQTRIEGETKINETLKAYNQKADAIDSRVSELEETKWLLDTELRLADGKHVAFHMYNSYDWRHRHNSAIGMKFIIKLGKSYEETRIEDLERKLNLLLSTVVIYGR